MFNGGALLTGVEILGLVTVCLLILLAVTAALLVLLHQRRVLKAAGGLAVALRRGDQRWAIGVGRYAGDELIWYRILSITPGAALRMNRSDLTVVCSRVADSRCDAVLPNLSMVVECDLGGEQICLGFGEGALTGFLSWLEAAAPRSSR
jgi:hypothetical protein